MLTCFIYYYFGPISIYDEIFIKFALQFINYISNHIKIYFYYVKNLFKPKHLLNYGYIDSQGKDNYNVHDTIFRTSTGQQANLNEVC